MSLRVQFWGTRGSIPSPGPMTVRYGGNTPCVELRTDDGWLIILDAGTGIRELGRSLIEPLRVLATWAVKHRPAMEVARAKFETLKSND